MNNLNKKIILFLFILLNNTNCIGIKNKSNSKKIQTQINDYKETQLNALFHQKSEFDCVKDTQRLILPNGLGLEINSKDSFNLNGLTMYSFKTDYKSTKQAIKYVEKTMKKKYNGNSSPFLKERLENTEKELKETINRFPSRYKEMISFSGFDNVIFENYLTNSIESETKIIENKHVIFLNDRLIDFCTAMSYMIFSMVVPNDSQGKEIKFSHNNIEDLIKNNPHVIDLFKEAIYHFLYDCPRTFLPPDENVFKFREYMEFFVLAHEYAHANYNHKEFYTRNYGFKPDQREFQLNKWMDELQADIFAQNLMSFKRHNEFGSNNFLSLMTAGAFYLACINVLEKSKAIIENKDIDADKKLIEEQQLFDKLIRRIDPFPYSLNENEHYLVDSSYISVMDSLEFINKKHPSAFVRGNILLSSVKIELDNMNSLPENKLLSFQFGVDMCQIIQYVFFYSKDDLIKKQ